MQLLNRNHTSPSLKITDCLAQRQISVSENSSRVYRIFHQAKVGIHYKLMENSSHIHKTISALLRDHIFSPAIQKGVSSGLCHREPRMLPFTALHPDHREFPNHATPAGHGGLIKFCLLHEPQGLPQVLIEFCFIFLSLLYT